MPVQPNNPFADLVPRGEPKRRKLAAHAQPGENPFADLVPQQGEQASNVGRKGDMRPGDRIQPRLSGSWAQGMIPFQDEIVSGAVAPVVAGINRLTGNGPNNIPDAYAEAQARQEAERAATEEAHPVLSPVMEAAGSVATLGGPAKRVLAAPGLVRKAGRAVATGALAGGLYGAGDQSGAGRLENARTGAETGAAVGLLAPGAAKLAGSGYRLVRAGARALTAPVRSLRRPEAFAASKVAEAAQRDQMSPQRLASRLQEATRRKPEAVLADVGGPNTQKLLRSAANVPSDARAGLTRTLRQRQDAQRGRLQGDLADAFGDPRTFHASVESLALARKNKADPLFRQAFATGTPWTARLQEVLSRPLTRRLVGQAEEAAANRGEQFKSFFAQQVPGSNTFKISRVPGTEDLHRVKVAIDDAIRKIKNREDTTSLGNVNLRDLTILKQHLVGAIDNPAYKRALREFAGDSSFMNAIDEGYKEGMTMEPEAIARALSRLSPGEADMWRLGFGRAVANKMRDQGVVGANRAEKLYSPKFMDRMMVVFRNPKERASFLKKLEMERRMSHTQNQAQGNSTTAQQLAEGQEAGAEAENIRQHADIGRKLVGGDLIGAMISWVGRAKNMATGLRPEVADEIIRLLTTKDPAKVARAQQMVAQQVQRLQQRQGAPGRIGQRVAAGAFGSIPSLQGQTRGQ